MEAQSRKGHTERRHQYTVGFQDSNWQKSGAQHTRCHSGWEEACVAYWCAWQYQEKAEFTKKKSRR